MLNRKRFHNVGFNGGIAEVAILANEEMVLLELRAENLRAEAQRLLNLAYEMGQQIAQDEFVKKNPHLL